MTAGAGVYGRMVYREHHDPGIRGTGRRTEGTHYLWDGMKVVAEYDGTPGEGRPPLATYYYAGSRRIARRMYGYHGRRTTGTEEFVRTRGGILYYHEDRLGSVIAITDRQGEPVLRYAYEAYGRPRAGVFGPYNEQGFTGQRWDAEVGLYYYGGRWYDPETGRFLSEDPVRDGRNWYTYVYNNPLNWIDPWGFEGVDADGEGGVINPEVNPFRDDGVLDQVLFDQRFGLALNYETVSCKTTAIINSYPEFRAGTAGVEELDRIVSRAVGERAIDAYAGFPISNSGNHLSRIVAEELGRDTYNHLLSEVSPREFDRSGHTQSIDRLYRRDPDTGREFTHFVYRSSGTTYDSMNPGRREAELYNRVMVAPIVQRSLR